jgi:hypothetical protein
LAFDSAGNLYVSNQGGNTIRKFTPGGVGSLFANTGLSNPTFMAFTDDAGHPLLTVPEPATWVMVGIGAFALVCGRRIRN